MAITTSPLEKPQAISRSHPDLNGSDAEGLDPQIIDFIEAENALRAASGLAPVQELQAALGLTISEIAACLTRGNKELNWQYFRRTLSLLERIRQAWESQFEPEAIKSWFRKSIPGFGGKTPMEMVVEGRAEEVWHALGRIEEGVHS